ncbi:TIGR03089 family protein [Actinomyces faecalis]|uniref:TIGR03089 family protein n=1 Tax=Actinomyces faecalis TaxID=2722820 RepID=UPI001552F654|nr:TIGR03089 family protein [Actinomyces faecalis]
MAASTDPLLPLLPQASDSDRPWLVWYAPGERVELTGHVLAMWAAKTAGLLEAEAGTAPRMRLAMEPTWRTVTWCLGTWLAGGCVVTGEDHAPADVSVAFTPDRLDPTAEAQVLVPRAPLAVRWEGEEGSGSVGQELPPLVLDGVADVMTYADSFRPVAARPEDPALTLDRHELDAWRVPQVDDAVGNETEGNSTWVTLSRQELAREAARLTGEAGPAALIQESASATALLAVLAAWRAGRTAVLVAPEADEALVATAARQERAARE